MSSVFIPVARFADGAVFGRHVVPGRKVLAYGPASDEVGVHFLPSEDGVLEPRAGNWTKRYGTATADDDRVRAAWVDNRRKFIGFFGAIGVVDRVVSADNGVLCVAEDFVTVPRFLPEALLDPPSRKVPRDIKLNRPGFDRFVRWLKEGEAICTSHYAWSGSRPRPSRAAHPSGPTFSFFVEARFDPEHPLLRSPRPEDFFVSWHGHDRGWSVDHLPPDPYADLRSLVLSQFEQRSAAVHESRRDAWWAENAEVPVLLDPYAELVELHTLIGEPSPLLWSDERFCPWLEDESGYLDPNP